LSQYIFEKTFYKNSIARKH